MKKLIHCSLITLILFSSSCTKKETFTPVKQNEAKEVRDVAYGTDSIQKMDLLFPEGYTVHTPVVFLLHGGGFIHGVKEEFENQAQIFKNEGFIVINLSYRLVDSEGILDLPPSS